MGILPFQTIQCLFQDDIIDPHAEITGLTVGVVVRHLFRQIVYLRIPGMELVLVVNDPKDPLRQKIRQFLFVSGPFQ